MSFQLSVISTSRIRNILLFVILLKGETLGKHSALSYQLSALNLLLFEQKLIADIFKDNYDRFKVH